MSSDDHQCPTDIRVDDYEWIDDGVLVVTEHCDVCGQVYKETMERTSFEKVDI